MVNPNDRGVTDMLLVAQQPATEFSCSLLWQAQWVTTGSCEVRLGCIRRQLLICSKQCQMVVVAFPTHKSAAVPKRQICRNLWHVDPRPRGSHAYAMEGAMQAIEHRSLLPSPDLAMLLESAQRTLSVTSGTGYVWCGRSWLGLRRFKGAGGSAALRPRRAFVNTHQ